ncbi:MAG: hypothetical protein IJV34_02490 [Prevotella sp.]|nr:hypothetical protein [Prevotella sp.]
MKTKLLILSLALMVMGGVSAWADGRTAVQDETDISSASAENPVEVTSWFTDLNTIANNTTPSEWVASNNSISIQGKTSYTYFISGSTLSCYSVSSGTSAGTVSVTYSSVPKGMYRIKVCAATRYPNAADYVFGNTIKTVISTAIGGTSAATETIDNIPVYDGVNTLTFGVELAAGQSGSNKGAWACIKDIQVYYLGSETGAADYTALLGSEITAAQSVLDTFTGKIGTGVFQFNASTQYDALNSAISSANTIYEAGSVTESDYNTQSAALSSAKSALQAIAMTAPDESKYYILRSNWNNTYCLNLNWVNADNPTETGSNPTISTFDYGVKFKAVTGQNDQFYLVGIDGQYLGSNTTDNNVLTDKKIWKSTDERYTKWRVIPIAGGHFRLYNTYASRYLWTETASSVPTLKCSAHNYATNETSYWDITEQTTSSVSMNITSAGWATFVAPFAVAIPDGVTAYTIETDGETITKTPVSTTIPANTPVLLQGDAFGESKQFSGYSQAFWNGLPQVGNLVGTLAATTLTGDGTIYLLQKNGGKLGWYQLANNAEVTSTANRAYLKVPAAAGGEARQFMPLFGDSETTAIMSVNTEGITANDYYNLQGQRISNPKNGLYIVGGKKVVVK